MGFGGLPIPKEGLDRFLDAMKLVIEEHFALFGVPNGKITGQFSI